MQERPKIKLTLTRLDKALEICGVILLTVMWIFTVYNYLQSPDIVPIHFKLSGQPDGYGSKMTLLLLPFIATTIYLGLTQLNRFPHIFNYTAKITADNADKQYTVATRLIRILKAAVVLIFAIDSLSVFLITKRLFSGLGPWFFPLTILILAVPIIYTLFQSLSKNKTLV